MAEALDILIKSQEGPSGSTSPLRVLRYQSAMSALRPLYPDEPTSRNARHVWKVPKTELLTFGLKRKRPPTEAAFA